MQAAVIVLGLAALGGLAMVIMRLRGASLPPMALAVGQGLIAATGVVLLIYAAMSTGLPTLAQVALGIFVLAALGGLFVFANYHLKGRPLPIPLIVGHGVIAVVGYGLLLAAYFQAP